MKKNEENATKPEEVASANFEPAVEAKPETVSVANHEPAATVNPQPAGDGTEQIEERLAEAVERTVEEERAAEEEKAKILKRKKIIKITSGLLSFLCVIAAALSVYVMWGVVPSGSSDGVDANEALGAVLGLLLFGYIYIGVIGIIAITCLVAGIITLTNKYNEKGRYAAVAVMGIADLIGVIAILIMSSISAVFHARWFMAFIVPFALDILMRVVCAVACSEKEKKNG